MNTSSYVKFWETKKLVPYQLKHPEGFSNNNILPDHQWIINSIFVSAWRFNEQTKDSKIYLKTTLTTFTTGVFEEKFIEIPKINFDNLEEENFLVYRNHEISVEHFNSSKDTIFYLIIRIKDSDSFYCMEYVVSNFAGTKATWPKFYRHRKSNRKKNSGHVLCVPYYSTADTAKENIVAEEQALALEVTDELKDDNLGFSFERVPSLKNEEPFSWESEFCTFKYQKENLERSEQYLSKKTFQRSASLEYETVSKEVKLMTKKNAKSKDLETRSCKILTPVFESTEEETNQPHIQQATISNDLNNNQQIITRSEIIGLIFVVVIVLLLIYLLYSLL